MFPEIETERLRLRLFRESDLDGFFAFHADPLAKDVYRLDLTRGEAWRRMAAGIGHWHLRGFGVWALEDKETKAYVGQCGLWFPEGWQDVEIGYGIHPAFRGKGLAVEAATRVRDYGYNEHKLDRLVSYIQPSNAQSIRVAEKLGARPDGAFDMAGIPHTIYLHRKP